jgi:hypothetical protein
VGEAAAAAAASAAAAAAASSRVVEQPPTRPPRAVSLVANTYTNLGPDVGNLLSAQTDGVLSRLMALGLRVEESGPPRRAWVPRAWLPDATRVDELVASGLVVLRHPPPLEDAAACEGREGAPAGEGDGSPEGPVLL